MISINIKGDGKYFREEDGSVYQISNIQIKEYFLFGLKIKSIKIEDCNSYNASIGINYNDKNFRSLSRLEKPHSIEDKQATVGFKKSIH